MVKIKTQKKYLIHRYVIILLCVKFQTIFIVSRDTVVQRRAQNYKTRGNV